jgi:hypothetical protein
MEDILKEGPAPEFYKILREEFPKRKGKGNDL